MWRFLYNRVLDSECRNVKLTFHIKKFRVPFVAALHEFIKMSSFCRNEITDRVLTFFYSNWLNEADF